MVPTRHASGQSTFASLLRAPTKPQNDLLSKGIFRAKARAQGSCRDGAGAAALSAAATESQRRT